MALPALVLFALALRLLLAAVSAGILRDGFLFIAQAELLQAGRWTLALRCPQHPLTAALLVLAHPLAGDWILAGQLLSALCGALVLVPIYLLTRDLVSARAGLVAAAAAAVSPYAVRFSAHVLSDAPFWLFMTLALTAGWWALSRRHPLRFALAGGLTALAYLTRPEGLVVGAAVLLGCLVLLVRGPRRRRAAAGAGLFVLAFLVVAGPYAYVIGGPTLKKNPSTVVTRILSARGRTDAPEAPGADDEPRATPAAATQAAAPASAATGPESGLAGRSRSRWARPLGRLLTGLWQIICVYSETWHYYLLALGVAGLLLHRTTTWRRGGAAFLVAVILLNVISHMFLYAAEGYLARRYAVAVGLAALPWTGAGWLELTALLGRRSARTRRLVTFGLVAVLLGSTLPKALKPEQRSRAGFREAGRWLARHSPPGARLMVSSHPAVGARALRVGLYAGGYPPLPQFIGRPGESLDEPVPADDAGLGQWWPSPLPPLWELPSFPLGTHRRVIFAPGTRRMSKLLQVIRRGAIDFLIVDHWEIDRRFGNFTEQAARVPDLKLVFSCPAQKGEPDTIFIYRVMPALPASRPTTSRPRRAGTGAPQKEREP